MNPPRTLSLLVSLALAASPLVAQIVPAGAATTNGPLGGSALSVLVNPLDGDEVLVTKDGNNPGLWRSTDRGETFLPYGVGLPPVAYPLVTDLTIDPQTPSTVYALFDTTIYKSIDFGANWAALPLVPEDSIKSVSVASSGGGMLAADRFQLYHSPDQGATWSVVHSVVPFSGLVLDAVTYAPSDPSVAYACGIGVGVLRSTDGGSSFAPLGHTAFWGQAITVDPTDADTVFVGTPFDGLRRSVDGGVTFAQVAQDLTATFNAEFFEWEPGGALWYGVLDGVLRSTDKGDNWTLVDNGISPAFTPIPLGMDVAPDGDLFLGQQGGGLYDQSGGGLYRMSAGTGTWEHLGFLEALINDIAIAGPAGTRVVGIGSGVYAAGTGEPVVPTAWHADFGTDTRAVAVDPDDPDRWLTGGVGAFVDNGRIIVVSNEGQDFDIVFDLTGSGAGIVYDIEYSPHDSDRVVAGLFPGALGARSILTSTDSGNTWLPINGTMGWATVALSFNPFVPGHVIQLSQDNQWSQSFNGGLDWQLLKPAWPGSGPAMLLEFDPFVPNRLYRGEEGSGLWRSDDAAATWTALGVPLHAHSSLEFHPEFPGMLWVGDDQGHVLISGDGGDSFSVAWEVPLGADAGPMAIDTADGTLVVGTTLASMWEVPGGSPVVKIAGATKGTGGFVPQLRTVGLPQLGSAAFALEGDDILGGALVYMALGFTQVSLPVFGGTFQIGSPVWRLYGTAGAPGVGGAGSFVAAFPLPANPILLGVDVFAQCAVPDVGSMHPSQVALSNALRITFHD